MLVWVRYAAVAKAICVALLTRAPRSSQLVLHRELMLMHKLCCWVRVVLCCEISGPDMGGGRVAGLARARARRTYQASVGMGSCTSTSAGYYVRGRAARATTMPLRLAGPPKRTVCAHRCRTRVLRTSTRVGGYARGARGACVGSYEAAISQGTYQPYSGATSCIYCPSGYGGAGVSAATSSSVCTSCAAGYYSSYSRECPPRHPRLAARGGPLSI